MNALVNKEGNKPWLSMMLKGDKDGWGEKEDDSDWGSAEKSEAW